MIAMLQGAVAEVGTNQAILMCGGIGYGIFICSADSQKLQLNKEAKLYIHEHIKEDSHDLYGFLMKETKELFEQLLSVKNVGPKVALSVLDIGLVNSVKSAIVEGDVTFLQTAKGVGKRAAEQIVVELRDKMGTSVGDGAENITHRSGINQNDEALQALISLGYTEADAVIALQNIDSTLSTEDRIKRALKGSK